MAPPTGGSPESAYTDWGEWEVNADLDWFNNIFFLIITIYRKPILRFWKQIVNNRIDSGKAKTPGAQQSNEFLLLG